MIDSEHVRDGAIDLIVGEVQVDERVATYIQGDATRKCVIC